MIDVSNCRRLTLMLKIADTYRADIALTVDRIYYRFATDESIEDGELPPSKEDFAVLAALIVNDAEAKVGEDALSEEVKVSVFVDNRIADFKISEQSLRRMVRRLRAVAEEFAFLAGFC